MASGLPTSHPVSAGCNLLCWEPLKEKEMLFVPDLRSQLPPYILLILGFISILAAVVFACIGKASLRFHGWVYRAEEPMSFWWQVSLYFLGGIGLIVLYLAN